MKSKLFLPIYFLFTIGALIVIHWALSMGNFKFDSVDGYDTIIVYGIDISYLIIGVVLMQLIGLTIMIFSKSE